MKTRSYCLHHHQQICLVLIVIQTKDIYIALCLACSLLVSVYYCYDNPSALESQLTNANGDFKLTNVSFNLLYTMPLIVML